MITLTVHQTYLVFIDLIICQNVSHYYLTWQSPMTDCYNYLFGLNGDMGVALQYSCHSVVTALYTNEA